MLVERIKEQIETVELGLPFYGKKDCNYFFISDTGRVLEVTHYTDGSVTICSKFPGDYFHHRTIQRAVESEPIDAEEFEIKFCEALTKIGQQLGLDPINLKAV